MRMADYAGPMGTWAGPMTLEHAEEMARQIFENHLNNLRFREEHRREGNAERTLEYQGLADRNFARYEAAVRVLARVRGGEQIVFAPEAEV